MNTTIEKIKNLRLFLLKQIHSLTTEQLNFIPPSHNNNIIWNVAHLMAVQQNLCYVRSGLPIVIEEKFFSPYMPGTKPSASVDEHEVNQIKGIFIASLERFEIDYHAHAFSTYTPSAAILKTYGFEVNTIESAIEYLLYHEGFHAGYILSLKHLVLNSSKL